MTPLNDDDLVPLDPDSTTPKGKLIKTFGFNAKVPGMGSQIELYQVNEASVLVVRDRDQNVLQQYVCYRELYESLIRNWYNDWVKRNLCT